VSAPLGSLVRLECENCDRLLAKWGMWQRGWSPERDDRINTAESRPELETATYRCKCRREYRMSFGQIAAVCDQAWQENRSLTARRGGRGIYAIAVLA
jgi:hypothetical protein